MFYQITEAFFIALRSISSYKLRMFLTTLGISIGIFSITVIFTLVNSMEHSVTKNLSALGNTVMFVHNWPWKDNSEDWYKYFNRPKVSLQDYEKLKANLENVVGVAFTARKGRATVMADGLSLEGVTALGVTYDYAVVQDVSIQTGRYFTPIEMYAGRNVCIIGEAVARALFRSPNCIGQTIQLNRKKLTIIGVMARMGANLFGDSMDDRVIMPVGTMERFYDFSNRNVDKTIVVKATHYDFMDKVESDAIGLVRLSRGLKPGVEDNFSINKQETILQQLNQIFAALNIGGSFISALSLFVGGFGIANIMFVSVKERTKEIGIQKALGATRFFILSQFLIEAVVLCLIGGLIGIGLLFAATGIATFVLNMMEVGLEIVVSVRHIFIGFGISVVVGLVFGFIPSYMAARLDPVEAIRSK